MHLLLGVLAFIAIDMEQELLTIVQYATPSVAFIFLTWKVLIPLTNLFIAKMGGTDISANARLTNIETNDLHDIDDMRSRLLIVERDIGKMKADIATLMERTR